MFTLPPEAYTYEDDETGSTTCYVAVNSLPDNNGIYILGDPFLRTFTTTFDYSEKKMELGININAPEGTKIESKLSTWAIFGIVSACIVVVALILLAIYFCYRRRKRNIAAHSHKIGGGKNNTYKNVWKGQASGD